MECPEKVKSPILRQLWNALADGMRRIENNDCSEAAAMGMLSRFNAESKGFYDSQSVMTYDEAMRETGIRNRSNLKATCDKYGIKQVKIKNVPIGFPRAEIENMIYMIREENKKKERH